MLDPVSASSLASSIVTFVDFTYKVGKRTYELSRMTGELPPDIQKCKDVVEILARATTRMNTELSPNNTIGPATALDTDLSQLFEKCTKITETFLDLLGELSSARSFSKVLKIIRKEGRLQRIHDALDKHLIEIMYLLSSQASLQRQEIKAIVDALREEALQHHAKLEAKMYNSIQYCTQVLRWSKQDVLQALERMETYHEHAADSHHVEIASGQRELLRNIGSASQNIVDTLKVKEDSLANKMEVMLREQATLVNLLSRNEVSQGQAAMSAQLSRIDTIMSRTLEEIEALRAESGSKEKKRFFQENKTNEDTTFKTQFEFSFRSDVVTIYVEHCTRLFSSEFSANFRFSTSTWMFPYLLWRQPRREVLGSERTTFAIILETVTGNYLVAHGHIKSGVLQLITSSAIVPADTKWQIYLWNILSTITGTRTVHVEYERKDGKLFGLVVKTQDPEFESSRDVTVQTLVAGLITYTPSKHDQLSAKPREYLKSNSNPTTYYFLGMKEELDPFSVPIAIAFIEGFRLLLAYCFPEKFDVYITVGNYVLFLLQALAFNIYGTVGLPQGSLCRYMNSISLYQSVRFLSDPAPSFDIFDFYAKNSTCVGLGLLIMVCFAPRTRHFGAIVWSVNRDFFALISLWHMSLHYGWFWAALASVLCFAYVAIVAVRKGKHTSGQEILFPAPLSEHRKSF